MEAIQIQLRKAIEEGKKLITELQDKVDSEKIEQFNSICEHFCDLEARFQLAQALESSQGHLNITQSDVDEVIAKKDSTELVIKNFEQSVLGDLDSLQKQIDDGEELLNRMVVEKPDLGKDYNGLIKLAKDTLVSLKESTKSQNWFKAAYQCLSRFSEISIQNEGSILLFGQYTLTLVGDKFDLSPPDVYIGDISSAEEQLGFCISEIMERILALRDFQSLSQQLNAKLIVNPDAPLIQLQGIGGSDGPIFALIGYKIHPLVEWGDVDITKFNSQSPSISMLQRITSITSY